MDIFILLVLILAEWFICNVGNSPRISTESRGWKAWQKKEIKRRMPPLPYPINPELFLSAVQIGITLNFDHYGCIFR